MGGYGRKKATTESSIPSSGSTERSGADGHAAHRREHVVPAPGHPTKAASIERQCKQRYDSGLLATTPRPAPIRPIRRVRRRRNGARLPPRLSRHDGSPEPAAKLRHLRGGETVEQLAPVRKGSTGDGRATPRMVELSTFNIRASTHC